MAIKNEKLGGTDFSTPTARVKPTDLNDTNDKIADLISESFSVSGKNIIRSLIDRAGVFSAGKDDMWGDAYVDADGREDSVVAALTDATFNTDKYTTTASATSYVYQSLPSGTFSPTISSAFGTPLISDWEEGANIQYKLTNDFAETVYVVVEASSMGTYSSSYDTTTLNIASGKWVVYCTDAGATDEEKRAKIYADLFNKTSQQILTFGGVTAIQTSESRDVGKQAHYAKTQLVEVNGTITYTGTFTDTSTNTDCSSWSDIYRENQSGHYGQWEIPSGTVVHVKNGGVSGWSREIGTDLSADELNNPATCQLQNTETTTSGTIYVESLVLCSGDISWVEGDSTGSTGGSPVKTWENIDYLTDHSIPVLSVLTDVLSPQDSGWLEYDEISSFTAFEMAPNTLIVKLIPKSSSPTAGFPSIKGFVVRGME